MPGSFLTDDLDSFFDTEELADICQYNGQSFGVHFFLEDAPANMFGERDESANAYMLAMTKYVADIKVGILVTIGSVPGDDAGSGLEDELIIDLTDSVFPVSGLRQLYVIKISNYGNNGLIKQIFLSKDKP